jgi:hypothetical protein
LRLATQLSLETAELRGIDSRLLVIGGRVRAGLDHPLGCRSQLAVSLSKFVELLVLVGDRHRLSIVAIPGQRVAGTEGSPATVCA